MFVSILIGTVPGDDELTVVVHVDMRVVLLLRCVSIDEYSGPVSRGLDVVVWPHRLRIRRHPGFYFPTDDETSVAGRRDRRKQLVISRVVLTEIHFPPLARHL